MISLLILATLNLKMSDCIKAERAGPDWSEVLLPTLRDGPMLRRDSKELFKTCWPKLNCFKFFLFYVWKDRLWRIY